VCAHGLFQKDIKAIDLDFSRLFDPRIDEGRIFFNQRRVVILDVDALGALRQQLIDTLGEELARGVLARFGYAHGYTDARILGESFSWETEIDWLAAGPHLHILEGIVHVTTELIEFDRQSGHFHMQGSWLNSYEAEAHLRLRGRSEHPVCWTLTGYASGYASSFFGGELLAIETECQGKGDPRCRWEIRSAQAWSFEAEPYQKALKAVDVFNDLQHLQLVGARFRDMALSSADWVWETDVEGRYNYCSGQVAKILGYEPEELMGRILFDLMGADEAARIRKIYQESVEGKRRMVNLEVRLTARNGREVVQLLNGVPVVDHENKRVLVRGVAKDITEQKRAEEALKESTERFRNLIETTSDLAWEIDERGAYTYVSPQVKKILGYEPAELLGKITFKLMPPEEAARIAGIYQEITANRKPFSLLENVNLHKNGGRVLLESSGVPFFDRTGRFRGYRGIHRDITERRHAEETIRFQAYHDLMTGLPNRDQLLLLFKLRLLEASRDHRKLAVIYLNLDRFKAINDSFGHAIGDQVIVAVAERLKSFTGAKDILGRVGSDEFILIIGVNSTEDAVILAQRIAEAMRQGYSVSGHDLYVTASIGISMYPEDSDNAEILFRNADVAASHVKERGRDNVQFFNPNIKIRTIERLLLESSLRHAIERNELEIHYQPLVNIKTGEVLCLEALVRWRHTGLGMLKPADFIPVAEEIGFIANIDDWVLRTACAQNRKWQDLGYPPLCVTVNLSAQQFQQANLVDKVGGILRETGLEPQCLDIEVTENTAMRDIDLAIPSLEGLKKLGVNISIDDFGTGYSSLNYLKRFPVQSLKIDQSFIKDVTNDPDDQAIVRAVIAMGHNLNLKVIAEGVETREQYEFLLANDCDAMQGFLFSKPLSADRIGEVMAGKVQFRYDRLAKVDRTAQDG
jgi:diguanylate cyclase (GGDEF)-like protein/PAS domain S-box-containing protein